MNSTLPKKFNLVLFFGALLTLGIISSATFLSSKTKFTTSNTSAAGNLISCSGAGKNCPAFTSASYHPNDKVAPIIYNMHESQYNANWRLWKPDFGPIGGWIYYGWKDLQPNSATGSENFGNFDRHLQDVCGDATCTVNMTEGNYFKPIALSVQLLADGTDESPAWAGGSAQLASSTQNAACTPQAVPNYGNATWQASYEKMVQALATKYDNDPRVDSIWITTGYYGETISTFSATKEGVSCSYDTNRVGYNNWAMTVPTLYKRYFSKKPIFNLLTRNDTSLGLMDATVAAGVGIKTNTLTPDVRSAYRYQGAYLGLVQYLDKYKLRVPIGFEHAYADNANQTYWSIMYALAHGADLIDLDGDADGSSGTAGDHFFRNLADGKMPWGESLWTFFSRHADRGPGGSKVSDDAWVVLRDTQYPYTAGTYEAGEPGDWEFNLYRLENTCAGLPAGTCDPNTDMGNGKYGNRDVGGGTQYLLPNQVPSGVYGAYGARKMLGQGLYFVVDPGWSKKSSNTFSVSVTYAGGTGSFDVAYCKRDGSPATANVQKEAGAWKNAVVRLSDVDFSKECAGVGSGATFAIKSTSAEIIHMVAIAPSLTWPPSSEPTTSPLSVSPAELTFDAYKGETFPAKQLAISGNPASPIDWTTSADSFNCDTKGMPIGITFSPRDGRTTASVTSTVTAQANTAPAGSCFINATVKPSATGSSVTPVVVKLNINIKEPSSLEVSKTSLTFSSTKGTNPVCQAFTVSKSPSKPAIAWEATISATLTWLNKADATTISPIQGNSGTSTSVNVCPKSASLPVGTQNTKIIIADSPETIRKEITVNLTITEPTPPPATGTLNLKTGWNKISWLPSYSYLRPSRVPQGCVVSGKYNNWFGDFLYNFGVNIYWPAQSGDLYVRCKGDVTWTL